jgi:hypothetical protein
MRGEINTSLVIALLDAVFVGTVDTFENFWHLCCVLHSVGDSHEKRRHSLEPSKRRDQYISDDYVARCSVWKPSTHSGA